MPERRPEAHAEKRLAGSGALVAYFKVPASVPDLFFFPGARVTVVSVLRRMMGILTCAALAAGVQGCSDPPIGPSTRAPFSQTDITVGTGTPAAPGNSLTVNYTGWLYDATKPDAKGLQFDSSAGGTPFTFTLGAGGVIAGWDEGLEGIKVGGVRRLVIPSSLAYGASRNGPIPPFSTLVFDIALVSLQ